MSIFFKPLTRKNKIITFLDDVFTQDTTTDTMLQPLEQYLRILKNENLKANPEKFFFFLDSVILLGQQIRNNHIHPLKSKWIFKIKTTEKLKKNMKLCWISLFHLKVYL